MIKVACYIDGFNIYHAIDEANRAVRGARAHLKWLDLMALMREFTDPQIHNIVSLKFFTAYPTWDLEKENRHRNYTKALESVGAKIIEGQFKAKDAFCKNCRTNYLAREEKESDVNIAMHLIHDAHTGVFDQAFLVTNDSDLLGPVRLVADTLQNKKIKIISPPFRRHSKELWGAASARSKIQEQHLEKCLLPEVGYDATGRELFRRPGQYAPPA